MSNMWKHIYDCEEEGNGVTLSVTDLETWR